MKIDRISFSTTIPIDAYGINDKIGAEAHLNELDDPIVAMKELIHFVESARNDKYPHMYKQRVSTKKTISDVNSEYNVFEKQAMAWSNQTDTASEIRNCIDLKELESYRIIARATPDLEAIYQEQYQKLTSDKK